MSVILQLVLQAYVSESELSIQPVLFHLRVTFVSPGMEVTAQSSSGHTGSLHGRNESILFPQSEQPLLWSARPEMDLPNVELEISPSSS